MATSSFLNRWSKRKLEQSSNDQDGKPQPDDLATIVDESGSQDTQVEATNPISATEPNSVEEERNPEQTSIANLLVSEASEAVKKAALRKLFLSEQFNVRDGLDDYDDDYSKLKSLSEGVADTLRDWIKESTDQEANPELQTVRIETEADIKSIEIKDSTDLVRKSDEFPKQNKSLYKNTVNGNDDALESDIAPDETEQNTPHSK